MSGMLRSWKGVSDETWREEIAFGTGVLGKLDARQLRASVLWLWLAPCVAQRYEDTPYTWRIYTADLPIQWDIIAYRVSIPLLRCRLFVHDNVTSGSGRSGERKAVGIKEADGHRQLLVIDPRPLLLIPRSRPPYLPELAEGASRKRQPAPE